MAHHEKMKKRAHGHDPLTEWLLDHASILDLKVGRYDWTVDWLPGFFDFSLTLEVGGKVFSGRGVGESEVKAFVKAGAEAVERCVFAASDRPNTNGFAVHQNQELARRNAVHEILERDAFFCHYLTRTPFEKIPQPLLEKSIPGYLRICAKIKMLGGQLHFGRMRTAHGIPAVACVTTGEDCLQPFGLMVGLGCAETLENAIMQAFLESFSRAVGLLEGRQAANKLTVDEFKNLALPTTFHHDELALDLVASRPTLKLFLQDAPGFWNEAPSDPGLEISFIEPKMPPQLTKVPVVPAIALCSGLQAAYFGHLSPARLNRPRLSDFCGRTLALADIESSPHVFG